MKKLPHARGSGETYFLFFIFVFTDMFFFPLKITSRSLFSCRSLGISMAKPLHQKRIISDVVSSNFNLHTISLHTSSIYRRNIRFTLPESSCFFTEVNGPANTNPHFPMINDTSAYSTSSHHHPPKTIASTRRHGYNFSSALMDLVPQPTTP